MLEAVGEILAGHPDEWPLVLRELRDGDQRKTSLSKLAQKTSLKMGLQPEDVEEILRSYTNPKSLSGDTVSDGLSKHSKNILIGAFLCLIDGSSE
jgi:hypothetical protein